jgi:4-hydroxybenzoate polyprenyltransferase/phosphoserine phosphatase
LVIERSEPTRLTARVDDTERKAPLVVDLDGTLVATDLLIESLFVLAKRRPIRLLMVPFWLAQGRGRLKQHLAQEAMPDVPTLPYRRDLIEYLEAARRRGTRLILATAADERIAQAVAHHLRLFDAVFASDGTANLKGETKRNRLVAEFGFQGFDYVGSGRTDHAVWAAARKAILVRSEPGLAAKVAEATDVERVLEEPSADPLLYLQALRPHHWLKNGLVFLPLAAAHRLDEIELLLAAFLAFLAFSLCASSTYLLNDLMDLPSDRRHPHKRDRALASGRLPLVNAVALIPLLLAGAGALGVLLPWPFLGVLGLYYVLTLSYSLRLKDLVILDVLALAGLHALRVMAGSAATGIPPSAWLIAFCVFLFFSLAMIKRYAELVVMRTIDGLQAHARAYELEDSELLAALGGASGYLAVLVLALYISETSDGGFGMRSWPVWVRRGYAGRGPRRASPGRRGANWATRSGRSDRTSAEKLSKARRHAQDAPCFGCLSGRGSLPGRPTRRGTPR